MTRSFRIVMAVLAALALIASACGGSDAASVDTGAVDAANQAAAEAQERADELQAQIDAMGDDEGGNAEELAAAQAELEEAQAAAAAADERAAAAEAAAEEAAAMAEEEAMADSEGETLRVAMVGNPNQLGIQALTEEFFTGPTGINVEYTILPEGEIRAIATRDLATGGNTFDVVQVGLFDTPQFGRTNQLFDLTTFAVRDEDYDFEDIFPAVRDGLSVDGRFFASPMDAESSFLMYRQDILDEAGLEMPFAPTWDEVAEIAIALNTEDRAGICLRGKPGWGDQGAAFTTVLNTFGGTWWSVGDDGISIGESQVDQPEWLQALDFYVGLIEDAGPPDSAGNSFNECQSLYKADEVAMWYDSTNGAPGLEADDSPVKGLNGYSLAPVNVTETAGWLWSWAFGIPATSEEPALAWEFISWATGPSMYQNFGATLDGGWAAVPPGTRQSVYDTPEYQEGAAAFAQLTLDSMLSAPILDPGTTPRPGLPGVQFVGMPQFQELGNACTEQIAAAISGSISTGDAQAACHEIASQFDGQGLDG